MFDIEKSRRKGIDETQIAIMERINENNRKEAACKRHEFDLVKINGLLKHKCKKCGCLQNVSWVCGYNRGLEHAQTGD